MIESSRECAYQLLSLQQQFLASGMAASQLAYFSRIIAHLIDSVKCYENHYQVLLVLKEVSARQSYFERVMRRLFNS